MLFGTSAGDYVDNVAIVLDQTPGDVTVAQATAFGGSSTLSATGNNIALTGTLTMGTGAVTLTATGGDVAGSGAITAANLSVSAATGLIITTNVTVFDAVSASSGDIVINQTGAIDLPDITAPANVSITATGNISQADGLTQVIATRLATFSSGENITLDGINDFKASVSVNT